MESQGHVDALMPNQHPTKMDLQANFNRKFAENNNDSQLLSLSDQTNHTVGLTMASLELINHNPQQANQTEIRNVSPAIHLSSADVPLDKMRFIYPNDSSQVPGRLLYGESDVNFMMTNDLNPLDTVGEVVAEEVSSPSLTALVNVSLHGAASPGESSHDTNSAFLTPNHSDLSSPMISSYIPEQQLSSGDTSASDSSFQDEIQLHRKYFKSRLDSTVLEKPGSYTPLDLHSKPETNFKVGKPGRKRKLKSEKFEEAGVSKEVLNRPPPHVLPPCKVCGIQATGFHYGVNTCEACKGFFRRSIIRKTPYVCANNALKCTISPGKRNTCPACRYHKCTEAGMSVEGIKIGRYTYAKRTQDILELQQDPPEMDPEEVDSDTDRNPSPRMSESEMQEFIDTVIRANESKYPESLKNIGFIEEIQKQIKDQYASGVGPSVSTKVPMEEFLSVLNTTGVQLDDRFQILQQWIGLLNDGLRYVITFAKDLPGFRDLSMADQMALIKHSICEVWIISRHKAFHMDFDLFTTRTGMTLDVVKALGEDLGTSVLKTSRRLRKLELTAEETIVLKAMAIFFTDRCDVEEPHKITAIQYRLLDALLHLFDQRGVNKGLTLGRISAILTDLRHITDCYQDYTQKLRIISTNTGAVEFPPLFLEVITFT